MEQECIYKKISMRKIEMKNFSVTMKNSYKNIIARKRKDKGNSTYLQQEMDKQYTVQEMVCAFQNMILRTCRNYAHQRKRCIPCNNTHPPPLKKNSQQK